LEPLRKGIDALAGLRDIRRYYGDLELHNELQSIVYQVLTAENTRNRREELLKQKVSELVSKLRSRIGDWRIVVPIDNLAVRKRQRFRMGKIAVFTYGPSHSRKALAQIKASLLRNPHYVGKQDFIEKYVKMRKQRDIGLLVGKTCAETTVHGRADDAFDEALPKIEEGIAGLKLFHYPNDDFYARYFGISGRIVSGSVRPMLLYPQGHGPVGSEIRAVGSRFEFELDSDRLRFMRACAFPKLSKILAKQERTHVEERIVTAVLWFAKAVDVIISERARAEPFPDIRVGRSRTRRPQAEMMSPYDRLLKLMVSLEAILIIDKSEPIQSNLAERSALLIGKDYPQRRQIVKFVKDMYDKRSGVVHHGGKEISQSELEQLAYLTQMTIVKLLTNLARWKLSSKESLQEWFLKKKLS
jgi:hypothetical protein